ncbi:hypothetical protein NMG60_11020710 [Bertholletia excelsa]
MISDKIYTPKHAIAFVSVLLLLSQAGAQSGTVNDNSTDQYPYKQFSPSMAIIIVILIAALFLMGFFSIYIRHCSGGPVDGSARALGAVASLRRRGAPRGLDTAVIETFPTFAYSEVKGLKIGKGALECAVCLNEFEDEETLRLIPKCDHVFHPECIDAWLESHVTCPVCRANLVPQPGETMHFPALNLEQDQPIETTQIPQNDDVSISIRGGEGQEETQETTQTQPPAQQQVVDRQQSVKQNRPPRSRSVRAMLFGKFPRSHSTGHSLVQPGQNTDRFTLRLPEEVRKQMINRGVGLPRESSSMRGYRTMTGEGSSKGGRSYRRPEPLDVAKSDRWVFSRAPSFFSRALSFRSPRVVAADGEGSTSTRGGKRTPKLPSFRHTEPKGDEPGLVAADSARSPV